MANQFNTPLFNSNLSAQCQNNNPLDNVIIIDITGV